MDNEKVAGELVKIAKELVGGRLVNLSEEEKDEIFEKTQKIVDKLSRQFPAT